MFLTPAGVARGAVPASVKSRALSRCATRTKKARAAFTGASSSNGESGSDGGVGVGVAGGVGVGAALVDTALVGPSLACASLPPQPETRRAAATRSAHRAATRGRADDVTEHLGFRGTAEEAEPPADRARPCERS